MTKPLTWFEVARRPKWVGGFFIAMTVAAICGLLAQWQGGRAIEEPLHDHTSYSSEIAKAPIIDSVIRPGHVPAESAVGTVVLAQLIFDNRNAWVVSNRVQRNGTAGYWVISSSQTTGGKRLIVTRGFTTKLSVALAAKERLLAKKPETRFHDYYGRLSPSEGAQLITGKSLASLSTGQLANLISPNQATGVYPLFLLETRHALPGLERITVETLSNSQINWLSAFYAIEWTFFLGFTFFMWWRLVRDEQQREQEGV